MKDGSGDVGTEREGENQFAKHILKNLHYIKSKGINVKKL